MLRRPVDVGGEFALALALALTDMAGAGGFGMGLEAEFGGLALDDAESD
jgi:hypothetical protein